MFSPSGEKLRSFGTRGSGQGEFRYPHKVAVDDEGNILVTDSSNHRIQKFTSEGQFLAAVGSGSLAGIAFNASNKKVYVVDRDNHYVQVFNSDLTFSSTFGKKGSGKGQFYKPYDIACDGTGKVYVADDCTGKVYVADRNNHRIQVFTAEGQFVRMLGRRGQGRGELSEPYGVAIDTSGMVYVSENQNHRISVFTSEGQFVTPFGRRGKALGEFVLPHGLAVDDSGVVCVTQIMAGFKSSNNYCILSYFFVTLNFDDIFPLETF